MTSRLRQATIAIAVGVLIAGAATAANAKGKTTIPLSASRMIIEFNSSAQDIGIQFFLDSDGWKGVSIEDPRGKEIFSADTRGILAKQGGGTELFLESVEPGLDELSIDAFFARFPVGVYKFRGRTVDGDKVVGEALFSHDVPAGPVVTAPVAGAGACALGVSLPAQITWNPVTTSISGAAIDIAKYEVIVEDATDAAVLNFDVIIPAAAGTVVTLPPEVLEPGTDYIFEVLAIEAGGNQTITEGCFTTAN